MRRVGLLLLAIVLIAAMSINVYAATGVTQLSEQVSVFADESCNVTITTVFHLEQSVEKLTFPLPREASNVTLNGMRVGTSLTGEARHVDLSRITGGMAGDFSAVITYRLSDVIKTNEEGFLQAQVPLLSGFSYPVEKMNVSVTLPGVVEAKPAFSSGYHQSNIEQDLAFSVSEATITVESIKALKDHETLTMTLSVTDQMFPQTVIELQDMDIFYLLMGICAALGLLYWLIFLRTLPPRRMTAAAAPEGWSAGQMVSVLRLKGADMTMMVFTWAQLGYILIRVDRSGRVRLYRQMPMGNERSGFEQKCFRNLFGSRDVVDATGLRYAEICRKTAKTPPPLQGLIHPTSGSSELFRGLMCGVGVFCGICLGLTLSAEAAIRWIPAILVAIICCLGSWLIQGWAESLFSNRRGKLLTAAGAIVVWGTLSIIAGTFALDGWIMVGQLVAGLMAAFGGRRTEAGRQTMSEVLGLRRYLRRIPKTQLQHICMQSPEYFYIMIPYAMALGAGNAFAKRFGKMIQPECPYIERDGKERMTASQWNRVIGQIVSTMDAGSRKKSLDNLIAMFRK